jgi:hypothetical protein
MPARFVVPLLLAAAPLLPAQLGQLTDDDRTMTDVNVVQLIKQGVPGEVILSKINECEPHFLLTPGALMQLRHYGVSDGLIRAMAAKQHGETLPGLPEKTGPTLTAPVKPIVPQNGSLAVKANTGRAGVFVDGKYLGPAANFHFTRTYAVAAGEHELKLMEPRYHELDTVVAIEGGKKTTIKETLQQLPPPKPPFGRLRTQSPDKFSAVYVDEQYMGHAGEFDGFLEGLLLNPGEYTVRIVPHSGAPVTQTVRIETGKTVIVK